MRSAHKSGCLLIAAAMLLLCSCFGPKKDPPKPVGTIKFHSATIVSADFKKGNDSKTGSFHLMDPSKTGLFFENFWGELDSPNLINTSFVSSGTAVGDFNNDGLPDIFVCAKNGGGKLFQNMGEMKFEDVMEKQNLKMSELWGTGATFADVNNDGRLDLYVCGYETPNQLFINKGDGFEDQTAQYGLEFNGASVLMTFVDYDLDGDLDAHLLTNRLWSTPPPPVEFLEEREEKPELPPELLESISYVYNPVTEMYSPEIAGQFDHFYRNDNGRFVEVNEESGIGNYPGWGLSATWWDFNDDGWPDLYVANDFTGEDQLFRNNGADENGKVTFTDIAETALPHTPWFSMGSDIADLNNDGLIDLMATDMAGTNHYRDKLSMGAMSGPDSDAWFLNAPNPPQYMRNAVYVNTGTERFMEVAHMAGLASSDWTWTVRLCDFDQDGLQDCFVTNGMSRDWFNGDLVAKAKELSENSGGAAMRDFWRMQPLFKLENMAFKNNGDMKFENVGSQWGLDHKGVNSGAATGDFDLDGDLDLVVCGFNEPLRLYRNDVATGNAIKIVLNGRRSNRYGLGARLIAETNSGEVLVRYASSNQGFMSSSEPVLHFGIGDQSSIKKLSVHWPSGCVQEFSDLAAKQSHIITEPEEFTPAKKRTKPDQLFAENEDAFPAELEFEETVFDDFERQPLLPNKYSQLGPANIWGDIDDDGDLDCFSGGPTGMSGNVLINQDGKLTIKEQSALTADNAHEDMGAVFFDADGDSDLDLYVVSGGVECEPDDPVLQDRLYLNDGQGNFTRAQPEVIPDLLASGGPVSAADFDRDGDLDLFVGGRIVPGQYPTAPESFLLVNEDGHFIDKTEEICESIGTAGMVTSCLWTDVDRDGWLDLMVTYEWNSVRLFKNEEGKLTDATESTGLESQLGWFNSIAGGDIDGDGDIDYVVGNFGLNSKYKASNAKREVMFYGDFENSGRKNIVEAKFEGDMFLPRRGLGCTSDAMPMFKVKTETYDEFATSSLMELYTEEKLDDSLRLEANRLDSMVLINNSADGKVSFDVKSLPMSAQTSSVYGINLVDVDGDGNLDLYAVQNFYGPQRETGYIDGGVSTLMLGDGKGSFDSVRADASGLVVVGDAKSLSTVDLNNDHRPDFVVGINSNRHRTFLNQSTDDASVVRISGAGTMGARVELNWADKKRAHEVYSTSSYLSQSTSDIFTGHTRPESAEVVWADGTETEHELQFENGVCLISKE